MLFLVAATVVAAFAAWADLRKGTIPNWLTLGALGLGVAARVVEGFVAGGWSAGLAYGAYSLAGAALCGLVPGVMFWMGLGGGADVKLFAALGALCHPVLGLEVETYAFAAAALLAPIKLAYEGKLLGTLRRAVTLVVNPLRPREKREEVPRELMTWFRMGPAVLIGAAASVALRWGSPWRP